MKVASRHFHRSTLLLAAGTKEGTIVGVCCHVSRNEGNVDISVKFLKDPDLRPRRIFLKPGNRKSKSFCSAGRSYLKQAVVKPLFIHAQKLIRMLPERSVEPFAPRNLLRGRHLACVKICHGIRSPDLLCNGFGDDDSCCSAACSLIQKPCRHARRSTPRLPAHSIINTSASPLTSPKPTQDTTSLHEHEQLAHAR